MHPQMQHKQLAQHTQHTAQKPPRINGTSPANAVTHGALRVSPAKAVLEVNDDELLHLATDIACLRAARYRAVDFDAVRSEDVRNAQAEIAALIQRGSLE